jgi:hypothetical protein
MLLPSPPPLLPPLRLSTPALSGRFEAAVTLSTVARLVASGTAVSKADLVPAAGLARTTVSAAVDQLLARGVLRLDGTRPTTGWRSPPGAGTSCWRTSARAPPTWPSSTSASACWATHTSRWTSPTAPTSS